MKLFFDVRNCCLNWCRLATCPRRFKDVAQLASGLRRRVTDVEQQAFGSRRRVIDVALQSSVQDIDPLRTVKQEGSVGWTKKGARRVDQGMGAQGETRKGNL